MFLMVLSMLCLGSWASLFKLAGKWRFELFYLDFAVGLMLAAVIYGFTFGNIGFDGFNFIDDLQHAGKRQWMYVFVAGLIFNLGNMLLMAAVSVSGLAVAFPMGMGIALLLGTAAGLGGRPAGNTLLLGLGCLLILTSVLVNAMSYRIIGVAKHEAQARAGLAKSTRRPSPWKGIILAVAAGMLIGAFSPLVERAREGDLGLGPYSLGALFAFGVFISSFIYDIFLMNLPVEGEPVEVTSYLDGKLKQHLYGLGAGIVWYTGILVAWVSTSVPVELQGGGLARFVVLQSGPIVAAIWGIFAFKEFSQSDVRVKVMSTLMMVLFLCGLAMIGLSPTLLRRE
jgi:glucose uptake protein